MVTWFRIEIATWIGIVFSNMGFMFLRSMFKHKIDHSIYLDDNKKLPSIDTMIALNLAGTSFHTEYVPAFVSTILYFNKSGQQENPIGVMDLSLKCVLVSSWIGTICVSILIFVSWQKGSELWKKCAPYIFYGLIILVFLILPAINITIQIFEICYPALDLKKSFFESWLCFYMVVCVTRIIEFFVSIRRSWIADARTYMETRSRVESLNGTEVKKLIEDINSENVERHVAERKIALIKSIRNEKLPYVLQQRKYGEGEIRLGMSIE